jgi:hypothetical protein
VAVASSPVAINRSNFYIDTSFGGVKYVDARRHDESRSPCQSAVPSSTSPV